MPVELMEDFEPSDLGFDKFLAYRDAQLEGIEQSAFGEARFQGLALPTGSGKSLVAMSVARFLPGRTVILTSTKGLQQQYLYDFEECGLVDIRGKANYDCQHRKSLKCDVAGAIGCPLTKGKGCTYEMARADAHNAPIVLTNYAYWLGIGGVLGEAAPLGEFDRLIIDEAHRAEQEVSSYLGCRLYEKEVRGSPKSESIKEWTEYAASRLPNMRLDITNFAQEIQHLTQTGKLNQEHSRTYRKAQYLYRNFHRIAQGGDDWMVEKIEGHKYGRFWQFDVLWPGRYTENVLFQGIPRVVLMSATLRPKTLTLMGVKKQDYDFQEWPRIFPPNRHPILYYPPKLNGKDVRLRYGMPQEQLMAWVEHIDNILDERDDRKGLIETVSYERQQFLMQHSKNTDRMIGNTPDPDTAMPTEVAQHFKNSEGPMVLVSPSFGTGYDFPYSECEFVIISKIPFKPATSKLMKARMSSDKFYSNYLTMQDLIQVSGRGMRHFDDRCEVFITDGNLGWFMGQNKSLAPKWFHKAYRRINEMPRSPEKL